MSLKTRLGILALAAAIAVAVQIFAYSQKISRVDANSYALATELGADKHWRYGYLRADHGAFLVRYPVNLELPELDYGYQPGEPPGLAEFMDEQLQLVPRKTMLEGTLYSGAVALLLFLPVGLRRWIRKSWLVASITVVVTTVLLLLPLVFLNYGASYGSTWVGPAPYSHSGPYLRLTWIQGLTVSYRPFLEIFTYVPRGAVQLLGVGRLLSEVHWSVRLLLPPLFIYGGLAALGSVVWAKTRARVGALTGASS